MRRRGDSITPLLLELARQNQDTMFESSLLVKIEEIGNVDLNPYLKYARTLLRERTQTMNSTLAECASKLLANHGSKQDMDLLQQVILERPYVARGVSDKLKLLERRLNKTQPMMRPEAKEIQPVIRAPEKSGTDGTKTSIIAWIAAGLFGLLSITR